MMERIQNRKRSSLLFVQQRVERKKKERACSSGRRCYFRVNDFLFAILGAVAFPSLLLLEPISAALWLPRTKSGSIATSSTLCRLDNQFGRARCGRRCHRRRRQSSSNYWKREQRLFYASQPQHIRDMNNNDDNNDSNNDISIDAISKTTTTKEFETIGDDLDSLRAQAAKLREESESLRLALQESKDTKLQKETDKIDGWINDLLIEVKLDDGNTELLKTVDQVLEVLTEDRYSAEQVLKIFKRLCQIREQESRSNCSPLMSLLCDATGLLDCKERKDNPNKRWNHKVEKVLRKRLFARDWNIKLESDDDDEGIW